MSSNKNTIDEYLIERHYCRCCKKIIETRNSIYMYNDNFYCSNKCRELELVWYNKKKKNPNLFLKKKSNYYRSYQDFLVEYKSNRDNKRSKLIVKNHEEHFDDYLFIFLLKKFFFYYDCK